VHESGRLSAILLGCAYGATYLCGSWPEYVLDYNRHDENREEEENGRDRYGRYDRSISPEG